MWDAALKDLHLPQPTDEFTEERQAVTQNRIRNWWKVNLELLEK